MEELITQRGQHAAPPPVETRRAGLFQREGKLFVSGPYRNEINATSNLRLQISPKHAVLSESVDSQCVNKTALLLKHVITPPVFVGAFLTDDRGRLAESSAEIGS